MLLQLKTQKKVVGIKQTKKAVELMTALQVFVANDADPRVVGALTQQCADAGVPVEFVDTMKALGEACGIEVGAATAAIVK